MADPQGTSGAPERDPVAELTDEERTRATRRLVHRLLWGGIAFLAVVVMGGLPALLSKESPALGHAASIAAWFLAPAIGVALLVFAVVRLRR